MASPPEVHAEWQQDQDKTPDQRAFRAMLLMRRFEEKVGQLYALGQIPTLPKLSIGREGLSAGLLQSTHPSQTIVAGRRCHALLLGSGLSADALMATLATESDGVFALFQDNSPALNHHLIIPKGNAEDQLKEAIALAVTAKSDSIVEPIFVVLDGADIDHDRFVEMMQDASAEHLRLIVLFDMALLPNTDKSESQTLTAQKSAIMHKTVNGIDYRAVEQACSEAAETIASVAKPVVLDIATQSFRGHGGKRRPQTRTMDRCLLDPVLLVRSRLAEQQASDEDALEQIEGWVRACINDAADQARRLPLKTPERR